MKKLFTFWMLCMALMFSTHASTNVSAAMSSEFLEMQEFLTQDSPGIPVLPLQNFESDTAWVFANGEAAQINKWYIGSASNITGRGKVAFISNNGGVSNNYGTNTASTYLCTKEIAFSSNSNVEEYILSFDWRAMGNILQQDGIRLGIYDPAYPISGNSNFTPLITAAVATGGAKLGRDMKQSADWQTERIFLMDSLNGKSKKLVYQWYTVNSTTFQPPAAIDNASIMAYTCAMPKNIQATYPTPTSINLTWNVYSKRTPTFNVIYRKSEHPTDTAWTRVQGLSGTSYLLTGLTSCTAYEIRVQKGYSATDTSLWSDSFFTRTSLPSSNGAFLDNFETFDVAKRAVINYKQTNKWEIGAAIYAGTIGKSAYISNDGGNTNHYDITALSVSHLYYDIDFPDTGSFKVSFDWRGEGWSGTSFVRVSLAEITDIPFAGTLLPESKRIFNKDFSGRKSWGHEELLLPNNLKGTKKRLVFTWQNKGSKGEQPPLAIDNVRIETLNCAIPENLKITGNPNPTTLGLKWDSISGKGNYTVAYALAGTDEWTTRAATTTAFNLDALEPNTNYDVKVRTECSAGASLYTTNIAGRTSQVPLILSPLQTENFESETYKQWSIVNGEQTNKWIVGTNVANGTGKHSLYITNNGNTNSFDTLAPSIVHFYRDITFPPQAVEHVLTFDWKGMGVANNAYMNVYLTDVNKIPQAGDTAGFGKFIGTKSFYGVDIWRNDTIIINNQTNGTTKRLVFTWINTGIGGKQPPIAIDNIKLQALQCAQPQNLKVTQYTDSNAVKIQFNGVRGNKTYDVYAQALDGGEVSFRITDSNAVITPLKPNTEYKVKVQNICTTDSSRFSSTIAIRMPQIYTYANKTQAFVENFENVQNANYWTIVNGAQPNKWFMGGNSYAPNGGNRGAYIDSTEDGTGNAYSAKATNYVHFYRDIQFDSSAEKVISFDWKCKGNTNGYFTVALVDLEIVPTAGTGIFTTKFKSKNLFSTDETWKRFDTILTTPTSNAISGTKKRLVFTWYNAASATSQPPVTIDNITVSTAECPMPTDLKATTVWSDSVALAWISTGTNFKVIYRKVSETNWSAPQSTTAKSFVLRGLESNTQYQIGVTNECGKSTIPKIITVTTRQNAVNLTTDASLYTHNFSNSNENAQWTIVDQKTGMTNKWYMGTKDLNGRPSSAYISNDGGTRNEYTLDQDSVNVAHLYRDIQFGTHAAYQFTFDWRAVGERNWDYLKVYLVDPAIEISAGKEIAGTIVFQTDKLNMSEDWRIATFQIKNTFANTQKRLVFSWTNDRNSGANPPAAFSNILIQPLKCQTPVNLRAIAYPNRESVVVTWDSIAPDAVVEYREQTAGNSATWKLDTVYARKVDTIIGLTANNTPYEIQVRTLCESPFLWSAPIFILSKQDAESAENFTESFEDADQNKFWGVLNGTSTNAWRFGTAAHIGATPNTAIYISNDNGNTNSYATENDATVVHFYRDFQLPIDMKELEIAFDWKAVGDTGDYVQAYLVDATTALNNGVKLPDANRLFSTKLNSNNEWERATALKLSSSMSMADKRLVFSWVNDNAEGKQMPAAIDNISVTSLKCLSVKNINATNITADSMTLAWTPQEVGSYAVMYRESGSESWTLAPDFITDASYTLTSLNANKLYEIRVQNTCNSNDTSAWVSYKARTIQMPSAPTFYETFENENNRKNWTILGEKQENKWVIDSITGVDGKFAAYISNDAGKTNTYSDNHSFKPVYTHLYRDIQFVNASQYFLSFVWRSGGNEFDYMQVSLVPENIQIKEGDSIAIKYRLFNKKFYGAGQWGIDSIYLDTASLNNKKGRLVFTWINNNELTTQPPVSIDDVNFKALDCKTPNNLAVYDYPNGTSLALRWRKEGNTSFKVGYRRADQQTAYTETSTINDSITTIAGLATLTAYEIVVKGNCGNSNWSTPIVVKTSQEPFKAFPMFDNFEGANNWVVANETQANRWVVGSVTAMNGIGKSIFVSNNLGLANDYNGNVSSITHFYRDIKFAEGAYKFELLFNWKALGNLNDRMQVHLIDVDQEPTAGVELSGTTRIGKLYFDTTSANAVWNFEAIKLDSAAYTGKLKRLVFTWRNDNTIANQPPAAVDNISILAYTCAPPTNVVAKASTSSSVKITWEGTSNSYKLEYRPTGYKETYEFITVLVAGKTKILEGLEAGTNYEFRVSNNLCSTGLGMPTEGKFSTPYVLPFFESFDEFTVVPSSSINPPTDWFTRKTPTFVTNPETGVYIRPDTATNVPVSNTNTWLPASFAKITGASKSAKITLSFNFAHDWLITPQIDLGAGQGRRQIEFKLGIANSDRDVIDLTGTDDKFGVFVSKDDNWSMANALDMWDASGLNRSLVKINATREGEKVRFFLDDYSGVVRIGFYGESSVGNAINIIYLDSVLVSNVTCKDVQNVTIAPVDLHTATINWQKADAEQYRWEVKYGRNANSMQTVEVLDDTFKALSGLNMATEYDVYVRAVCDSIGTSNWSPVQTFQTTSTCASIPDSLHIVAAHDSAVVSWAAGTNNRSWQVRYGTKGQDRNTMTIASTSTISYTIKGLNELTDYVVYVRAICTGNDTSGWSSAVDFETAKIPCDSVWNLRASAIMPSTVTLNWDAKNGQNSFELRYGTSDDKNGMTPVSVTGTQKMLSDLANNSSYFFYVRSICRAGDTSAWSRVGAFKTIVCPGVDDVWDSVNSDSTAITAYWNKKPGQTSWQANITEYVSQTSIETSFDISDTSYVFDNNIEKKKYKITARSKCGNGDLHTNWSNIRIVDLSQVGINDVLMNNITIHLTPNPAKDHATLSIDGAEGVVTVSVISVKGDVISTEKLNCSKENTKELSFTGLSKGTYVIRLVHNNWTTTKKLIVQ